MAEPRQIWSRLVSQSSTYSQLYNVKGKNAIIDKGRGGSNGFKLDRKKTRWKKWTGRQRESDEETDRALDGLGSKTTEHWVCFNVNTTKRTTSAAPLL